MLRALHDAGVKIDLVAGRGIGVVSAMYAAIDGGATLWGEGGVWRGSTTAALYRWNTTLRAATWTLVVALTSLLVPLMAIVGGAIVYPVSFFLQLIGLGAGERAATGYARLLDLVFQPTGLPLLLPRFVMATLVVLLGILVAGEVLPRLRHRGRRRARGLVWWRLVGSPLGVSHTVSHFTRGLWQIMRGAVRIATPAPGDLAQRYAELLSDNLGQPGFRELIVTAHDLDTRRDLVLALLGADHRQRFFARRLGAEGGQRFLETMDLGGDSGCDAVDALAASLCLPIVTDAHSVRFSEESQWRGELHQLCDRPGATGRLLEEVAHAGAEQVIVVTALPESTGPYSVESARRDARGRAGAQLASIETPAVRDALASCAGRFQSAFQIRPIHNPLGPFDFAGGYDERSDRLFRLHELVQAGRDDGFRQFVDPVVGASGEWIRDKRPAPAPESSKAGNPLPTLGTDR